MTKYLINGFRFMHDIFRDYIKEYRFVFISPEPGKWDLIKNFLDFRKFRNQGRLDTFEVVHINSWENFFNIKNRPYQIWIAESHGIHIGLENIIAISQSSGIKKLLAKIFEHFICIAIRKFIKRFDIYYYSIPNVKPYALGIRKDALWLPNPIDNKLFRPQNKRVRLEGNPAILYPTKLHPIKGSEFAFKIFEKIKSRFKNAKLHIIKYPEYCAQNFKYKEQIKRFEKDIIWHEFYKREHLPALYSSADLVLGAFNFNEYYANLNLVELEAMACGAAVICHDKYEVVKKQLKDIPDFALKLLRSKNLKRRYSKKCRNYVLKVHSADKVCQIHLENIKKAKKSKSIR